jgi:hypothetical protein
MTKDFLARVRLGTVTSVRRSMQRGWVPHTISASVLVVVALGGLLLGGASVQAQSPQWRPNALWQVSPDGQIWGFPLSGTSSPISSTAPLPLDAPIVGMVATPSGQGYWLVARDGGVFAFGDAQFYGSANGLALNQPIVGMAATPDGGGYWLVAADGGVFGFGDAGFHGSAAGLHLAAPVSGIASTPSGAGYWLVAQDGGVFSFGNARYYGSANAFGPAAPVIGITSAAGGTGYWLDGSDGGVFSFGTAPFFGSQPGPPGFVVGPVLPTPDQGGYILSLSHPLVFLQFGDALACLSGTAHTGTGPAIAGAAAGGWTMVSANSACAA